MRVLMSPTASGRERFCHVPPTVRDDCTPGFSSSAAVDSPVPEHLTRSHEERGRLGDQPLAQVVLPVWGRVSLDDEEGFVPVPVIERGSLERVRREHDLAGAASSCLCLGGNEEPRAESLATAICLHPEGLDLAAVSPRPAVQSRTMVPASSRTRIVRNAPLSMPVVEVLNS